MRWTPLMWCLWSCQTDLLADDPLPALDEPFFRCDVQPLVTKSCGMLACHGDPERYYVVYGRNRLRLDDREKERNALLSDDERAVNFAATLAFVDLDHRFASEILDKPLDLQAGGSWHGGAEVYRGGDVYTELDDRDRQVWLDWLAGATEDPGCEEPGSSL